jgi:hypothetical protein
MVGILLSAKVNLPVPFFYSSYSQNVINTRMKNCLQ